LLWVDDAHGLGRDHVAPDWPPLTLAELNWVAAAYPALGEPDRIAWHSPRPFAASGIVACAQRDVFVKRHHTSVRDVAALMEEHAFIQHLRTRGAAVPEILTTGCGQTAVARGEWVYELHALANGVDLYRDAVSWSPFQSAAHAGAAGRALGHLHGAAQGFAAPARAAALVVADFAVIGSRDPMDALRARLAVVPMLAQALHGRPWERDFAAVLMPWHAHLRPHLTGLAPLWTHNDFHASNLLWREGRDAQVSAVLDFGLANRTCAAFDLATALERNCVEWLRLADGAADIAHAELARALIGGYRQAHAISPAELAAVADVLPLVHVEFALSELAYFHGVLASPAKSELAYGGFLLNHARWFGSRAGTEFLRAVRDACA
jgi:Ser/Thr protein kinase RdoA (MazF antagonist)